MLSEQIGRMEYFWWAATHFLGADTDCPGCGGRSTRLIRRKYLVTALFECPSCHLRFRVPKETAHGSQEFYAQETYQQGFTTSLPSREELTRLLESRFAGMEKDFGSYIEVLQSLLPRGATVLDFGSSWGYGSWQIEQAGFTVFSYEIGRDRARYAKEHLGCRIVEDLRTIDGTIDCFFSASVIEHVADPNLLFLEAARVLKPDGYFVCFCPNGSPERERLDANYHKLWGKVHLIYITPQFMRWACARHGFELCDIPFPGRTNLSYELVTIARKKS